MANDHDLLVSTTDAAAVATLCFNHRSLPEPEADAAGDLADALANARTVPDDRLPADRVSMNARVHYTEEPGGARRSVHIVHPRRANPAEGRVSVLSPVGRSLLGRRSGSVTKVDIPGGRGLTLRIVSVERAADDMELIP
jgi:regulator of nucleoside diphosphate kinase